MYGLEKLGGEANSFVSIYGRHIELACSEAWKSNFRTKMSCLLIRGGSLLSLGHNYIDNGPKGYYNCSFHAEMDAILNCRTPTDGAKALVYRFSKGNNALASSEPCPRCRVYLTQAGIKYVICVDTNLNLKKIKL